MKVEQDVLKLIKKLNEHEAEVQRLRQALYNKFRDAFDGVYIDDFFIVDEPEGDEQDDGEWCDQYTGHESDTGSGTYYYAVEGSKKYIAITYGF